MGLFNTYPSNTGTTDVLPPPQSTTIDDDLPTENAARTDVFAI